MLLDGIERHRAALGLADHRDQAGLRQHHLGELVHARRGGRAGGADDFIAYCVHRTDVVNDAVGEVNGKLLALRQHVLNSFVCRITARKELSGKKQELAGFPAFNDFLIEGIQVNPGRTRVGRPRDLRPVG